MRTCWDLLELRKHKAGNKPSWLFWQLHNLPKSLFLCELSSLSAGEITVMYFSQQPAFSDIPEMIADCIIDYYM